MADKTTLGADNGISVALILAALEDRSLVHGPLEALLTVDEEAGMGGAHGLKAGMLQGSLMLNLDTEEWGEFYLGCAGGLDVNDPARRYGLGRSADYQVFRIELSGLRGGHSGVDISAERAGQCDQVAGARVAGIEQWRCRCGFPNCRAVRPEMPCHA